MATEAAFEILESYEQISPFLDSVRRAGDAHRNEFGFLAASVYVEFARNQNLYVLVERTAAGLQYAGHLLFQQRYPTARIVQMFTDPGYRRQRLASRMIDHFRAELTAVGFTSIYASVAEDLVEANAFWQRQQFHVQAIRRGGETRKRQILRRCHELESPQLIPASGVDKHNPLGLAAPAAAADMMFLLDLNVVFDLTGPRRVRHEKAVSLFQAERLGLCKLAISGEMRTELHRTATPGKLDPMEGFIDILPELPLRRFELDDVLLQDLLGVVFPHRQELTKNDKSDLCHIATVIQHGLAGLVTNDSKVLEAAPELRSRYGIELLSSEAFILDDLEQQSSVFESEGCAELTMAPVEQDQASAVHALLRAQGISASVVASKWLPMGANALVASRFCVWEGSSLVGYITWSAVAAAATMVARMGVDSSSPHAADAARAMLMCLLEQLPQQGPRRVDLEMPMNQTSARDVAIKLGFRGAPAQHGLHKIILGGVLTVGSWAAFQQQLFLNSKIKLPAKIPDFQHHNQQVPIIGPDGNRRFVALDELESLLAPALLCLPGRPAVITPIRRSFAEPLLGHSPQGSFLAASRASLFKERHYISAARTLGRFKRGTLILFYESSQDRGCCALVAIARVRQAYLKIGEDLRSEDLEQSVLTSSNLGAVGKSKTKAVTAFDNIFVLPRPVSLATLQRLGCGSAMQLRSTNPISAEQLHAILQEAFSNG